MVLSEAELEHFQREGWLVAKGVLPREVVEAVQVRCHRVIGSASCLCWRRSSCLLAPGHRSSAPQLRSQIVH